MARKFFWLLVCIIAGGILGYVLTTLLDDPLGVPAKFISSLTDSGVCRLVEPVLKDNIWIRILSMEFLFRDMAQYKSVCIGKDDTAYGCPPYVNFKQVTCGKDDCLFGVSVKPGSVYPISGQINVRFFVDHKWQKALQVLSDGDHWCNVPKSFANWEVGILSTNLTSFQLTFSQRRPRTWHAVLDTCALSPIRVTASVASSSWQSRIGAVTWENGWDLWLCTASLLLFGIQVLISSECRRTVRHNSFSRLKKPYVCRRKSRREFSCLRRASQASSEDSSQESSVEPCEPPQPAEESSVASNRDRWHASCCQANELQWLGSLLAVICFLAARYDLRCPPVALASNICSALFDVITRSGIELVAYESFWLKAYPPIPWIFWAVSRSLGFLVFLLEVCICEVSPHELSFLLGGGTDSREPESLFPFMFEWCNMGVAILAAFVFKCASEQYLIRVSFWLYLVASGVATPFSLLFDRWVRHRVRSFLAFFRLLLLAIMHWARNQAATGVHPFLMRLQSGGIAAISVSCSMVVIWLLKFPCTTMTNTTGIVTCDNPLGRDPPPIEYGKLCLSAQNRTWEIDRIQRIWGSNPWASAANQRQRSFTYMPVMHNGIECPLRCNLTENASCGRCVQIGIAEGGTFRGPSRIFEVSNVFAMKQQGLYFYGENKDMIIGCGIACNPTWGNWPTEGYYWHELYPRREERRPPQFLCSLNNTIVEPILIVSWQFPRNAYHFYTDTVVTTFMTVGHISKIHSCSSQRVHVRIIFGSDHMLFRQLWESLFGDLTYVSEMDGCYKTVFWGHMFKNVFKVDEIGAGYDPTLSSWLGALRFHLRGEQVGLVSAPPLNMIPGPMLLVHHDRAPDWFRRIDWAVPGVEIRSIHLDQLPFKKQIDAIAFSRGLLGIAGAGLANSLFLPPRSILLFAAVFETTSEDELGQRECAVRMSRTNCVLQEENVATCHVNLALNAGNSVLMWRCCRHNIFNDTSAFDSQHAKAVLKLLVDLSTQHLVEVCIVLDGDTNSTGWPRCDQHFEVPPPHFLASRCGMLSATGLPYNLSDGSSFLQRDDSSEFSEYCGGKP